MTGAVTAGAVIVAGATIYAADQSSSAIKSSTNASIAEQNKVLNQQQSLNAPYLGVGQTAIPQYENLLGIGPQGTSGIESTLQQTPGYQFTQQQGETGILNAASASGGVGGNTLAALDQYNTGLADQTYQNAVGNARNAVALGQGSAVNQSANVGQVGGNISNALINQGNTIAGINANEVAGISKAIGGTVNNYTTQNTLSALNNQAGYGSYPGQYDPSSALGIGAAASPSPLTYTQPDVGSFGGS